VATTNTSVVFSTQVFAKLNYTIRAMIGMSLSRRGNASLWSRTLGEAAAELIPLALRYAIAASTTKATMHDAADKGEL